MHSIMSAVKGLGLLKDIIPFHLFLSDVIHGLLNLVEILGKKFCPRKGVDLPGSINKCGEVAKYDLHALKLFRAQFLLIHLKLLVFNMIHRVKVPVYEAMLVQLGKYRIEGLLLLRDFFGRLKACSSLVSQVVDINGEMLATIFRVVLMNFILGKREKGVDSFRFRMLLTQRDDPREGRLHELRLTFHEELYEKVIQGPLRFCLIIITLSYLLIKLSCSNILSSVDYRTLHATPHLAARPHTLFSDLSLIAPLLSPTDLPLPQLSTPPLCCTSIPPALPFLPPSLLVLALLLLLALLSLAIRLCVVICLLPLSPVALTPLMILRRLSHLKILVIPAYYSSELIIVMRLHLLALPPLLVAILAVGNWY